MHIISANLTGIIFTPLQTILKSSEHTNSRRCVWFEQLSVEIMLDEAWYSVCRLICLINLNCTCSLRCQKHFLHQIFYLNTTLTDSCYVKEEPVSVWWFHSFWHSAIQEYDVFHLVSRLKWQCQISYKTLNLQFSVSKWKDFTTSSLSIQFFSFSPPPPLFLHSLWCSSKQSRTGRKW